MRDKIRDWLRNFLRIKQPFLKIGDFGYDDIPSSKDGKWHNFTMTFDIKRENPELEVSTIKLYDRTFSEEDNDNKEISEQLMAIWLGLTDGTD